MTDKRLGIIYLLTNSKNGKQYIGQTVNLNKRISQHKERNTMIVDKAIDKYGWDNFETEILEDNVPVDELGSEEAKYIAKYDTYKGKDYNCTPGGETLCGKNNPMYGKHRSEEAKQKMSDNHPDVSGKNNPMYGKERSEEVKQKMSESTHTQGENHPMYGKHHTKEAKQKMSEHTDLNGKNNPFYGKHHTKEVKQKMRDNHADVSGKNNPFYGKHHSEEAKQKMSESKQGENHPSSKISKEESKAIERTYNKQANLTQQALADKFDVARTTIGRIVRGEHWTTK